MRLVQLYRDGKRRVACVADDSLLLIAEAPSSSTVYDLALEAIREGRDFKDTVENALTSTAIDYAPVWEGRSDWQILPSFDHPHDSAHCLVTGTGLTHKASVDNRAAMHAQTSTTLTDSQRMYQLGLEGGRPPDGVIGVQPEWFYKGSGSVLCGHRDDLLLPWFGDDGGEEPEIAGAYLISPSGEPVRVGFTVANEFSDHVMEKKNYLYLAPSKLRRCAIGPELNVGEPDFGNAVEGKVTILRNGSTVWTKDIATGERTMCHSVANLEHHHFKYEAHRHAGDVHIHFFGASAFSFGDGVALEEGDWMEVSFPRFGRPLRNRFAKEDRRDTPVQVKVL